MEPIPGIGKRLAAIAARNGLRVRVGGRRTEGRPLDITITSQQRFKNNRYGLRIPGTIPGGYPEYPDPTRGCLLSVVMMHFQCPPPRCLEAMLRAEEVPPRVLRVALHLYNGE